MQAPSSVNLRLPFSFLHLPENFGTLSNLCAVESILRTTIRSGTDVRYTRITSHVEALQFGRFVGSRTTGTVKAIHDKDGSFILLGMISRKDFGRETFASLVHGCNLETIHQSRFCMEGIVIVLHVSAIVPFFKLFRLPL